jgi:hypothetical protein
MHLKSQTKAFERIRWRRLPPHQAAEYFFQHIVQLQIV